MEPFSDSDFDECLICLNNIANTNHCGSGNPTPTTHENNFAPAADQGDIVIRLLEIQPNFDFDSNLNMTPYQTTNKTRSAVCDGDTNKHKTFYCQSCTERNNDISNLFFEIGRLFRKLHVFKLSVMRDLNESFLHKKHKISPYQEGQEPLLKSSSEKITMTLGDQQKRIYHRKQDLRQRLLQLLQLNCTLNQKQPSQSETTEIEMPLSPFSFNNNSPTDFSDEPGPEFENTCTKTNEINLSRSYHQYSSTKEAQNPSKFLKNYQQIKSDDFSLARKLHGIKECSVHVNKITSTDNRKASLRNRIIKSAPDFDAVTSVTAQAPSLSPFILEPNSPSDLETTASVASISSDAESDSGSENGDTEYSIKPRKKYVKSKTPGSGPKNTRKQQNQSIIKPVVAPKTNQNENQKKSKKPPYRPLTIFCTREFCTRKQGFSTEKDLEYHVKQAHEGITHPFECTFPGCTKSFPQKKYLRKHYNGIHLGKFPHCCHFCGEGFTNTTRLKQHFITHTKVSPHKCLEPNCGRVFLTAHGLQYHKRSAHTGERPYRCDRCGKGFFTLFKLRDHLKAIHEKEDRPFICELCAKSFPIYKYLYTHMRNTHNRKTRSAAESEPRAKLKETTVEKPGLDTNKNKSEITEGAISVKNVTEQNNRTEYNAQQCNPTQTDTDSDNTLLAVPVWNSIPNNPNLFYPYSVTVPNSGINSSRLPYSSLQSQPALPNAIATTTALANDPFDN